MKPNGKYFFTRNSSTIIAFSIGGKWKPGNGFTTMVSHTDSPVPMIKPISKSQSNGYLSVGVELYGGGLWNTWFDRDLSIAGRVIATNSEIPDSYKEYLVKIDRPILRIPMLAIHLQPTIRNEGFKPNLETHTEPILGTVHKILGAKTEKDNECKENEECDHHPALISLLANEIGCDSEDIRDFQLSLYDTQKSCLGGLADEFIFSARLDNQMMCFVILSALINSNKNDSDNLANDENIRLIAMFDNEEVGSKSNRGADSRLLQSVFQRLSGESMVDLALQRSIVISCDMAHAVHPNYSEKHEKNHKVELHKGLVVKYNSNERYATTDLSSFFINEIARRNEIPIQKFVVRNDSPCGSTVGPSISSWSGVRTVDVGIAQLAMHSIREMCATSDIYTSIELLTHFFNEFQKLDAKVVID